MATQYVPPDYMTPRQAAVRLQVSDETVKRRLRAGKIPGALKIGRQWRIPRAWLEDKRL